MPAPPLYRPVPRAVPMETEFSAPFSDEAPLRHWYAVYVRSRHEFVVHEELDRFRIEHFLPTVQRLRRWKDRKKLVTFPLFPGYLFVHIPKSRDAIVSVLKTKGVVRMLGKTPGSPESVPEVQIESLKTLVASGKDIEVYPFLCEGQRVRIKWGPLAGIEGILKEKRGQHILVLSVDILQQGASVRVDAADVEPL